MRSDDTESSKEATPSWTNLDVANPKLATLDTAPRIAIERHHNWRRALYHLSQLRVLKRRGEVEDEDAK